MRIRSSAYPLIVVMVIMLVVIGSSLRMEYITSKLLPLIIGSAVFIVAAVTVGREIFGKGKSGTAAPVAETNGDEETGGEAEEGWYEYLIMGGWLVGFFLAIFLLGFLIAIPLFVLSYLKSHGTKWLVAAILTILTTAFIYGVFDIALDVDFYPGLLFIWLD